MRVTGYFTYSLKRCFILSFWSSRFCGKPPFLLILMHLGRLITMRVAVSSQHLWREHLSLSQSTYRTVQLAACDREALEKLKPSGC